MIKKLILILLAIVIVGLIVTIAFFYKPDLTREELADTYINEQSKFIDLPNGANMHYRDEGNPNGPVVVMIHGGFGSLQNWEGWVSYLNDDYRLISMDLLGHGLTGQYPDNVYDRHTERGAIHMLLQAIGVNKYTLAGNSFGGGIALEMALEYPDEVEGLILVDSEGVPNGEDGYDTSLFNDDELTTPDQPDFNQPSWLENIGSKFLGPAVIRSTLDSMIYNKALITDEFVEFYGRILRHQGNREAQLLMFRQGLYLISQNGKMDLLPRLKEIQCPTLVMQGRQDSLVPMRVAELLDQNIAISDLALVEEAGHMSMIEKPQETAEMVKIFFTKYNIGGN